MADPKPVSPFGGGSEYVMGLDWDAAESARAELFVQSLVTRSKQVIDRSLALTGNQQAYLALLARTSAARATPASHLDEYRR